MPCHAAIVKKNVTALPDELIKDVIKKIRKEKVNAAAIVDKDGLFLGLFSMKILLKNLVPVSVAMAGGIEIDIKVSAAPGVSKRLENVKHLPVQDLMDRKPTKILPDTPIWEGVSLLTKLNAPLVIVDNNGKFHGLVSYDSLVESLENTELLDS